MDRIKVLVVAPYPALLTIVEAVEPEFPDMDITVEVGDLETGLDVTRAAFSQNYDVLVSRGGTAQILDEELQLPVVEIELSTGDILRQTRGIPAEGPRLAAVGFGNTFGKLAGSADLLPRPIDIETVDFADEVPLALERLAATGHQTYLCDNYAYTMARKMGLDARLLVSGPESVRLALRRAQFYVTRWREGVQRNRLLWKIIQSQPGDLVLFDDAGRLVYSSVPEERNWLIAEIERRFEDGTERFVLSRSRRIWRVRRSSFESDGQSYVVFTVVHSREPVQGGMAGIEYLDAASVKSELEASVFHAAGTEALFTEAVKVAVESGRPVMLRGEVGSGKDQIVKMLYLASGRTKRPYVTVDCSLLSERTLQLLTDSYASPLYETDQTICLRALQALSPNAWHKLLAIMRQTNITKRNLVLLSGNDNPDGSEPDVLAAFTEQLRCHVLTVAPLRARPDGVRTALLGYFAHVADEMRLPVPHIDEEALAELEAYPWPRNYLQLRKVVDWLSATCAGGRVTLADVQAALEREGAARFSSTISPTEGSTLDLLRPLGEIERDVARLVLASVNGNHTRAAESLGISRTTLWRLLKE